MNIANNLFLLAPKWRISDRGKMSEQQTAKGLFKVLFSDYAMHEFISRKVAGIIYIALAWATVGFGAIAMIAALGSNNGTALFALLIPIAAFLFILILRMAFEASIALIAIAENTKK